MKHILSARWWSALALIIGAIPVGLAAPGDSGGSASQVPVETLTLDNGMKLLLVRKPEMTTVVAGWVAHVGSANERPGITGISHLFEHMMFKGTPTIGTKNAQRDQEIIKEQEALQEQLRVKLAEQRARYRKGEVTDPFDKNARTPEMLELDKRFQALVEEQRALMVKDEFDQVYTAQGGARMNAFTNQDMTVYFITVPANKIELWFWMESDRLKNPVFREFYSERDVVHEERRLRTESTPTGKYDELFNAMFWQSHPYSWPVVGWPSDLEVISKAQADDYFATYYAPNNLTAALVGNFDTARIKDLAQRYFGRIPRGPQVPPDVVTLEMKQLAEKRMQAECDCQPQIEIRYHTVPFMHADSYALEILTGLLNGQTGRLNKSLILDKKIASSASARQESQKWDGTLAFSAETKGDATPADLEAAWNAEVQRIVDEPLPAEELQKVKNQSRADSFRRLENPFFLMIQLLVFDGWGDWRFINVVSDKLQAVTDADVKRVAKQYLTPANRAIAVYTRKAGSTVEAIPPELADVPPQMQQGILQQAKAMKALQDPAQLAEILTQLQARKGQAPPQFQKAMGYMEKVIQQRIEELKSAGAAAPAGGDKQ